MMNMATQEPNSRLRPAGPFYQDVRWSRGSVDGFEYLVAEVQLGNRTHKRVIATEESHPDTYGSTLMYADSYVSGEEPETFVYARHFCGPIGFFQKLNSFLDTILEENPELKARKYPIMLAVNGKARIGELPIPYQVDPKIVPRTSFFRLDLPFGATTIEFTKESRKSFIDMQQMQERQQLVQAIESPLAGFDFTESSLYTPLLLSVHWAAKLLPISILEAALGEISLEAILA